MQTELMVLPPHVVASAKRLSKKRGHAAAPGTGPAGETCGSCTHLHENRMARTYWKCLLTRSCWTGGERTDVRRSDPACSKWKAPT